MVLLIPGEYFLHFKLAQGAGVGKVGFGSLDHSYVAVASRPAVSQGGQEKERCALLVVDRSIVQCRPGVTTHRFFLSLQYKIETSSIYFQYLPVTI